MLIRYVSDLHLEHCDYPEDVIDEIPDGADVLALAGDIVAAKAFGNRELQEIFRRFSQKANHVLYVLGNHEYYGSSVLQTVERLHKACILGGVKMLDRDVTCIEGKRFVGCTLWFPSRPGIERHEWRINDFRCIKANRHWFYDQYQTQLEFLRREVDLNSIVITHHLPSEMSVAPQYEGDDLNMFFVGPADDVIRQNQPELWIHGHTHNACDYAIGRTRVTCNPRGYPSEQGETDYQADRLVTLL